MRHVCIVVDNPLRDLDGAVLLARKLTEAGLKATLVPMYDQGFVIPALRPDLVVLNYFRKNNLELVRFYKELGISVAVVDTEGLAASPERYALSIHSVGFMDLLDLYCVWGKDQFDAVKAYGEIPQDKLVLTGCQRTDYAALPWRRALKQYREPGYILLNTNFPVANPRFSDGGEAELKGMLAASISRGDAMRFVKESREACEKVRDTIKSIAQEFPDLAFVIRPHPFENLETYMQLTQLPNVEVRQEGTSFEWLAPARLLLHLNCSTAVEAAMLGVPALSLEWINTDALRLKAAGEVSTLVSSYTELKQLIQAQVDGASMPKPSEDALQGIVASFHEIDGKASERICEAVLSCLNSQSAQKQPNARSLKRGVRAKAVHLMRMLLGLRVSVWLGGVFLGEKYTARRRNKELHLGVIQNILDRLDTAAPLPQKLAAERSVAEQWFERRLAGQTAISVKICE